MKKFYVTTSIAYTNAPPHIGFALELVQADVLARYHRLLGEDVFYLTGTDEHGIKIAKAAKKEGKTPQEFADEISEKFRKLTKLLNISNDDFIRTSDEKKHWPSVRKIWLKLKEKGDIYKKKYKGFYCSGCEAFITEKDLIKGKCPFHGKKPEFIEEENYFFRLSKYSKEIKKAVEKEIKIVPEKRKNEILSFLERGLEDISFSRPKEKYWGFSVPEDSTQTIYCWADALSNYISALGYAKENKMFRKYWPADVHCLGKDIQRFHAIIWPAMLLSLGLELPKTLFIHGFITVGGEKMSKSRGNIINPFEIIKKYGTDSLRYYLLAEIPSTEDGDFTYEKFERRYISDLASGIGNLLARVKKMVLKQGFYDICLKEVSHQIEKTEKEYKREIENFRFHEALKTIWRLICFCDKLIEKEKPWETDNRIKKDKNKKVLGSLLEVLDKITIFLSPFLPETAEKIAKEIKRDKKTGKIKNKEAIFLFPRF